MALIALAAASRPAAAEPASPDTQTVASETKTDRAPQGRASLAELRARLNEGDLRTALGALHIALSQISDGATYVWRKRRRNLTGVIRPTSAFRNASGQVCRHVIYTLALGSYRKRIEGVACREISGRWTLSS